MKISNWMLAGLATALSVTAMAGAQTGAQTGTAAKQAPAATQQAPAAAAQKPAAPLQLQNMGQVPKADPFPQANPEVLYGGFALGGYSQCVLEVAVGV